MPRREYSINFVGDVMLGRLIDQLLPEHVHESREADLVRSFVKSRPALRGYNWDSPWGDTIPIFHQGDLNVINLETSVTTHADKWPDKVFNYRMHPKNIKALEGPRIDYVSFANNHTLDFGETGLVETVKSVKNAGLAFAGAGKDPDEARRPAVLSLPTSDGSSTHKVCIWAASDHPRDWESVPNFHLIDYSAQSKKQLKELIARTTPSDAALKIMSIHWGPNYAWQPAQKIQDLAHYLIEECGIDVIHGHSSHHVQGVEKFRGKLIIYGCGDFVDDYALVPNFRNDLSGIWRVLVEESEGNQHLRPTRLEVFPSKIENFSARRLSVDSLDSRWVREKISLLSANLGTEVSTEDGGEGRLIVDLL